MMSKGNPIDWHQVGMMLDDYMRRTRGTFNEQTFWHSQGGFECFFTMNPKTGKMVRNTFFDIPIEFDEVGDLERIDWKYLGKKFDEAISGLAVTDDHHRWIDSFWEQYGGRDLYFDQSDDHPGSDQPRVYKKVLSESRVKIDWGSIRDDWAEFWTNRGFGKDHLEGYKEFWNRLGGIDRYFDTDDKGNRTQRDFKRPEERRPVPSADIMEAMNRAGSYSDDVSKPLSGEDICKVWDKFRGPVAESETRETYIQKITIDSSLRRHSLHLGENPKIVFCERSRISKQIHLWVERVNDLDLGSATKFDFFHEDEVIPSDYHHVFSFRGKYHRVSHLYMQKVN